MLGGAVPAVKWLPSMAGIAAGDAMLAAVER